MFDKLSTVESRYDELMHRLGTSEVQSDPVEYRKAAKALSDMEPLVEKYRSTRRSTRTSPAPRSWRKAATRRCGRWPKRS